MLTRRWAQLPPAAAPRPHQLPMPILHGIDQRGARARLRGGRRGPKGRGGRTFGFRRRRRRFSFASKTSGAGASGARRGRRARAAGGWCCWAGQQGAAGGGGPTLTPRTAGGTPREQRVRDDQRARIPRPRLGATARRARDGRRATGEPERGAAFRWAGTGEGNPARRPGAGRWTCRRRQRWALARCEEDEVLVPKPTAGPAERRA